MNIYTHKWNEIKLKLTIAMKSLTKDKIDKHILALIIVQYIEDITWLHGDTKFLFECWKIFHEWAQRTSEMFHHQSLVSRSFLPCDKRSVWGGGCNCSLLHVTTLHICKIKELIAHYWNKLKQIKIDTNGKLATLKIRRFFYRKYWEGFSVSV